MTILPIVQFCVKKMIEEGISVYSDLKDIRQWAESENGSMSD